MRARMLSSLLRVTRPPLLVGVIVGVACVTAETFLTFLLERVAPSNALNVVYLVGVLVVSYLWGLPLGMLTAVASGFVYDYFLVVPRHAISVFSGWSWMPLLVFLVVGLLVSAAAALMRTLLMEAEERRGEADLEAATARLLLRAEHLPAALPVVARRLAQGLGLPFLAVELGATGAGDPGKVALPLSDDDVRLGTLVAPANLPAAVLRRLRERVVPSLEAVLAAACDREAIGNALATSRDELARVADEQAALRRVATLVARGVRPAEIFGAVAREMGLIVNADHTAVERYEPDRTVALMSFWSASDGGPAPPIGSHRPLREDGLSALVLRTGQPARMAAAEGAAGELETWVRDDKVVSAIASPIVVEARLWGVVIAFFRGREPQPEGIEERIRDFTELVATAISNAQARDELAASRARVVAASDETRHRIERDLHDGAQQRLVSLGLQLRMAETAVPPELPKLREQLSRTAEGLTLVLEDLRELSRGIHPAILSKGGLAPALKMLARRSSVPVDLRVRVDGRLPERVEVAVYYIVSESLTNVAKHAHASLACVEVDAVGEAARVAIRDDGKGGADPRGGSGLIGLLDRVQALGGTIEITSPAGHGTTLTAVIPVGGG
ncbi:GAF domain-containing sensor histidine kinase [Microbispora sp. H10949]|uniref:GAF domain-containing sensor histidine kinase n=1 Tax=Microbispora sp. H10949 TaxID=2729111 RepID=UPI0015FFDF1F|nr:GAF domain-containing protein [Microbispora sp. H10949]